MQEERMIMVKEERQTTSDLSQSYVVPKSSILIIKVYVIIVNYPYF